MSHHCAACNWGYQSRMGRNFLYKLYCYQRLLRPQVCFGISKKNIKSGTLLKFTLRYYRVFCSRQLSAGLHAVVLPQFNYLGGSWMKMTLLGLPFPRRHARHNKPCTALLFITIREMQWGILKNSFPGEIRCSTWGARRPFIGAKCSEEACNLEPALPMWTTQAHTHK